MVVGVVERVGGGRIGERGKVGLTLRRAQADARTFFPPSRPPSLSHTHTRRQSPRPQPKPLHVCDTLFKNHLADVDRDVEEVEGPVHAGGRHHQARVDGAPDDAPQGVPPPVFGQVTMGVSV